MIKILKALYFLLNVIIIIALITVHFVIKDRNYDASLLFYTFPLPVIILIILALSIFLNRKMRTLNLILALLLFIVWLSRSFKINFPEDINETDLEIVFWNASHDRNFEDAFIENNGIPDVLVFVEYHGDLLKETKLKYPDYYFYEHYSKEIGVFSKTPIQIIEVVSSKFGTTILNFETNGVNFYAVDVAGSMDVPREWGLKLIDKAITEIKHTIVLGDFNVPYESLLLEKTKANLGVKRFRNY